MGHPIRPLHRAEDTVGGDDAPREFIILGGRPVASTGADRTRVNETRSVAATGFSSMELLAAFAGPTFAAVVVLRRGADGLAFVVERGRVVGAFGSGPRGSMQAWSKAARTQEIERCLAHRAGAGVGMVKMFIDRCVLEHLWLVDEPGAEVSILRGDARWIGSTLEVEHAPSLQHLLMEFARESDDCAQLEPKLEPLSRYIVPATPPQERRHLRIVSEDDAEEESSFASVEVEHAQQEQEQELELEQVWRLCSGQATVESVLTHSVLGRARTLRALDALRRQGCIELSADPADLPPVRPLATPRRLLDTARLAALYPEPADREEAIGRFIGDVPVWLADLEALSEARDRQGCLAACGALIDAADAVAAGPFLDQVMAATRMAHAEAWVRLEAALSGVSASFSQTFRALLDQRGG